MIDMDEKGYWINVPQGRGARLIREVDWSRILGLYTGEFTTCSLLVAIGKNRIFLTHLDKQFSIMNADDKQLKFRLRSVRDELAWVKEDDHECRIVIVHKEGTIIDGMTMGMAKINAQYFQSYFKKFNYEIELHCVEDLQRGIVVSFKDGLQPYPREPLPRNLLCHPDEFKFNTAHQIEDSFYHLKLDDSVIKPLIIFNGFFWQPIDDKETNPQFNSSIPQCFLDMIKATMTTLDMLSVLTKKYKVTLADKVVTITFSSDTANAIGPYISLYKNDYDVAKCLKLNLDEYILQLEKKVKEIKGEPTRQVILTAVKDPAISYQRMFQVVEDILEIDTSNNTKILCTFLLSWASFYSTYESKITNVRLYPEWQQHAQRSITIATKHLHLKEYQAAINNYESCLPLLVYSSTEEKDNFLIVTMNLAMCYYELENFPLALRYFNIATDLTQKHPQHDSKLSQQFIEIIDRFEQGVLNETDSELSSDKQASSAHTFSSI